jgi:hypothetical protein
MNRYDPGYKINVGAGAHVAQAPQWGMEDKSVRPHGPILRRFSKHGRVVEFYNPARPLFRRIHHAGIKRTRIDMQAHGALPKLFWIDHSMHRIGWINRAGVCRIHFHRIGGYKLRAPMFNVLRNKMKVFDL